MKIRVRGVGWVTMLLRDLDGRRGVTLLPVTTRGGKTISAGVEVVVEAHARYVNLKRGACEHCGVAFDVRLDSTEAARFVELLPPGSPAAPREA